MEYIISFVCVRLSTPFTPRPLYEASTRRVPSRHSLTRKASMCALRHHNKTHHIRRPLGLRLVLRLYERQDGTLGRGGTTVMKLHRIHVDVSSALYVGVYRDTETPASHGHYLAFQELRAVRPHGDRIH